jgi:hypothetical protein
LKSIIVDLQVFQSPAWDRGMGKYTLELITEISKIAKKNNLSIDGLLSNRMAKPKGFDDIVKKQLKNIKITTLDLLEDKIGDKEILIHNKSVIDDYISEKFNHQKKKRFQVDLITIESMCSIFFEFSAICALIAAIFASCSRICCSFS